MNIQEIRDLKKKLEDCIGDEVASFHRQTGLRVAELSMIHHEAKGASGELIATGYEIAVRVEV
jgi:hypothetical protein